MSTEGGTKAVIAAMIANGGIAVTKFGAFAITGSSSMLSEAIHSVADTGNQALLLIGGKRSLEAPDAGHQFGYGRRRYVYAFVVAIILFMLGGMFSLYEGWHKFSHPEELTMVWVAYLVLFIAIALESWSFRTAFREANKSRGTRSLKAYIQDTRQPELPVVLLEDLGALLGLFLALFGITMAVFTGDPRWDGVGSLAIGTLLLCIAVFLAFEVSGLLVGESALPEQEVAIRAAVTEAPGVSSIIHMRTLHTGPDELLVAVKIGVLRDLPSHELALVIDDAEQRVRAVLPTAKWIYIEPDITRAPAAPAPAAPAVPDAQAPAADA
ncbi:MAG TPA: cation diffusion facilitator family transporter [Motilibacterales bacterium]|nr:cation diffusion facilitator family transporter [Motilibacterales bacterium]